MKPAPDADGNRIQSPFSDWCDRVTAKIPDEPAILFIALWALGTGRALHTRDVLLSGATISDETWWPIALFASALVGLGFAIFFGLVAFFAFGLLGLLVAKVRRWADSQHRKRLHTEAPDTTTERPQMPYRRSVFLRKPLDCVTILPRWVLAT